jgi:hypothetical protein
MKEDEEIVQQLLSQRREAMRKLAKITRDKTRKRRYTERLSTRVK